MSGIYLLTGANLGVRTATLRRARQEIKKAGIEIIHCSDLYETAPWGNTQQPSFLNQALEISTTLSPSELLTTLKIIETEIGRVETTRWGARLIDIDILLYKDIQYADYNLEIPHPRMADRRFTLVPLHQIGAAVVHPFHQKTIHTLLNECSDFLPVKRYCASSYQHIQFQISTTDFYPILINIMDGYTREWPVARKLINNQDGSIYISLEGPAEILCAIIEKLNKLHADVNNTFQPNELDPIFLNSLE